MNESCSWRVWCCGWPLFFRKIAEKSDILSIAALLRINSDIQENKIYIVRGQNVMLDADLAKIYGYSTKAFNQQVKNNIEKFEEDFMFLLTDEEANELSRSKILTLNKRAVVDTISSIIHMHLGVWSLHAYDGIKKRTCDSSEQSLNPHL